MSFHSIYDFAFKTTNLLYGGFLRPDQLELLEYAVETGKISQKLIDMLSSFNDNFIKIQVDAYFQQLNLPFIAYNYKDEIYYIKILPPKTAHEIIEIIKTHVESNNEYLMSIIYAGREINETSEIINGSYIIFTGPKLNPEQMSNHLFEIGEDIRKISRKKPISTLASSTTKGYLRLNFNTYSPEDIETIKRVLSEKIGIQIDIFIKKPDNSLFFYSKKHLQILGELFGFSLEESLQVISTFQDGSNIKIMDFIFIAFGDIHKSDHRELSPQGESILSEYRILISKL